MRSLRNPFVVRRFDRHRSSDPRVDHANVAHLGAIRFIQPCPLGDSAGKRLIAAYGENVSLKARGSLEALPVIGDRIEAPHKSDPIANPKPAITFDPVELPSGPVANKRAQPIVYCGTITGHIAVNEISSGMESRPVSPGNSLC